MKVKRALIGIAVLALVAVAGCKALTAPVEVAQTPEQKAYALYGTFVVFEEAAASIATDATTATAIKNIIKKADATAKPAADALLASARQVITIQTQLADGKTPEEKLDVATKNLAGWITDAKPKILALQCAVNPKQLVCREE
jgi:hypothetical protein